MDPALRSACARLQLAPDQHPYVPPMAQVLARALRKADVREMVILRGAVVAGYFQFNLCASETAHYCSGAASCGLEAMMVDRRVQAQGIGYGALRQLPETLRRHVPRRNQIRLTVNFSNRPAQKLYARCGFVDTGAVFEGAPSGPQHIYSLMIAAQRQAVAGACVDANRERVVP